MDERQNQDVEQINLIKYQKDSKHKIYDKFSSSMSDSGQIISNIRRKNLINLQK
mgnify:CR=1 FL=1